MRYFLIDKVTELEVGRRVRGIKNITLSDEVLHDHFPDHPIMPGALIIEAAAQLGAFLLEMTVNQPGEPLQRALLVQIDLAKFHEPAGPGDQLDITATIQQQREHACQVGVLVQVGDRRVAQAGLTFVLKRIESERVHEQRRYIYQLWTRELQPRPTILA
jgi:3-hydroxyacyl-[acyl-carrier-protein] dehydratase